MEKKKEKGQKRRTKKDVVCEKKSLGGFQNPREKRRFQQIYSRKRFFVERKKMFEFAPNLQQNHGKSGPENHGKSTRKTPNG